MSKFIFDTAKSIEQLENDYWKHDNFPTRLVEECYVYRKIPLRDLTIEQLRFLIQQNIGLNFLICISLDFLKTDILAEGDYYEGDLLHSILQVNNSYWLENRVQKQGLMALLQLKKAEIEEKSISNNLRQLLKQIDDFIETQ